MKTDRLLGIIMVLLQKEKVTATYLAERFEVSKRTINRDIEAICMAGIPAVTTLGAHGGIAIADGYKIDKTLLTEDELRAVFTGLLGLDSVAQDKKYQGIIDKLFVSKNGVSTTSHIRIDLSSHYKNSLAPKIEDIERAIAATTQLTFTYYGREGERRVTLEPYYIVFQWSSWYVFGRDCSKKDFRLFKLNRLWELQHTNRVFELQEVPQGKQNFSGYFTDDIEAVILFDPSVRYRLVEEYGPDCYTTTTDGKLRLAVPFTNQEYLLSWVLQFGDRAELLQPPELRTELRARLQNSLIKYRE